MSLGIDSCNRVGGCIESLIGGRKEQQDAAGYKDVPLGCLVVVCDGMGGGNGGGTASKLAVQTIIDDMSSVGSDGDAFESLRDAIAHANAVVYETGQSSSALRGMGTTLTALLINKRSALVAHVGDSRVYQLRYGRKVFRTSDHSMVFDLVRNGLITEEQAREHPQSNVILRALGIGETVEPEIIELSYNRGDRFILCTDGYWGLLPETEFLKLLKGKDVYETVDIASKTLNGIGVRQGGGHDNMTIAMIDVKCNSKLKPKMRRSQIIVLVSLVLLLLISVSMNVLLCRYVSKKAEKGFCGVIKEWFSDKVEQPTDDNVAESAEVVEGAENE